MPDSKERTAVESALTETLLRAELPSPDSAPGDIARIKVEIAADLAPFDAIDVLASLVPQSAFGREETYSELTDEPGATIEYIASVLLERPSREPVEKNEPDGPMSRAIQRTLDRTRGITMHAIMAGRLRRDKAAKPIEAIASEIEAHDSTLRWPGYSQQEEALLRILGATDGVSEYLGEKLGFDFEQALRLADAIGALMVDRYNAHMQSAADRVNELEARLDQDPDSAPSELRVRNSAEREKRGYWLLAKEVFSPRMTDALLVDASELSSQSGVEIQVAQAFLDAMSCEFGETRGVALLTGRSIIRQRPFVHAGDSKYLLTAPGNLLWGVRPIAEAALKASPEVFNDYAQRRSGHTEEQAAELLATALSTNERWTNLNFELNGKLYETDALVCLDDTCFVVEVKSGQLSEKAKRGRVADVRRELEQLVGKAAEQCVRLQTELDAGRTPAFFNRSTGAPIAVDLSAISNVESIVVTLQDLSVIGVVSPLLHEAGILPDDQPPWIVSLFDLETIAKSCPYAAVLTSYIHVRRNLDPRVEWADECDLWMLHLRETLDFRGVKGRWIFVAGRSDPLNKAWLFGTRDPKIKLDNGSKKKLQRLNRERPPGFLAESEALLERAQHGRRPNVTAF